MTADLNTRTWFTSRQAADYAGVNIQTIAEACRSGALRAGQPFGSAGGRWRINRADLDAWLRGERAVAS
jgi:excisionase family DNA binding protein